MPLYEYRCEACAKRFEILQPLGAGADGVRCTHCGHERVVRQLSTFAAGNGGGDRAAQAGPAGCCRGTPT